MMGEVAAAAAARLNLIPVSDNTIQRRITDMASEVKEHLLDGVHESSFFSILHC